MPSDETYKLLVKRISEINRLIKKENVIDVSLNPKEERQREYRLMNLREILDVNMRAFAMIFNRNFDNKLDNDLEIQ